MEASRSIDVNRLRRAGYLRAGWAGGWQRTDEGEKVAWIIRTLGLSRGSPATAGRVATHQRSGPVCGKAQPSYPAVEQRHDARAPAPSRGSRATACGVAPRPHCGPGRGGASPAFVRPCEGRDAHRLAAWGIQEFSVRRTRYRFSSVQFRQWRAHCAIPVRAVYSPSAATNSCR